VLGRCVQAVWRRLHDSDDPRPARIPATAITDIGSAVRLSTARADLANQALEDWARTRIVAKLPGAGHAPE